MTNCYYFALTNLSIAAVLFFVVDLFLNYGDFIFEIFQKDSVPQDVRIMCNSSDSTKGEQFLAAARIMSTSPISHSLAWSVGFQEIVLNSTPDLGFHYYLPILDGIPPVKSEKNALLGGYEGAHKVLFIGCRIWTFPTDYDEGDVSYMYTVYDEIRTQNLDRTKLSLHQSRRTFALPLGLDFHSLHRGKVKTLKQYHSKSMTWDEQMKDLLTVRQRSRRLQDRIPRVLTTFSRNRSTSARHAKDGYVLRPTLHDQARASPLFDFSTGPRLDQWKKMSEYAFIFSPIGNGLDCFRFWEALALGCIVIVQRNPVATEFSNCFPVIQVDDISSVSKENLSQWHRSLSSTPLEQLAIMNWLQPSIHEVVQCGLTDSTL